MNEQPGSRPDPVDRINAIVSNARPVEDPLVQAPPTAFGWSVDWPSSFQDQPIPPRLWCVPEWVPDRVVTLLSGDGGTGKSLLAMQLATCCALGLPFMGIELARRKVLYLAAEDDLDELKRRQADINTGLGIDFADLDQQLFWKVLSDDNALLCQSKANSRTLEETATYKNLRRFCIENGIQLLIVDTVADTFGGLEIDRQQVTKYIRLLGAIARDTDGAVIALAHPGVAGLANGTGISGSTAWRNAVRSVVYMRRPTEDEASGPEARDLRIVQRLKGNFAATGAELQVSWWRGHFVSADNVEPAAGAIDVIATEVKVMAAIRRATSQSRRLSFSKTSIVFAPKILMSYAEVKGLRSHHIERAIDSMLARGDLREAYVGRPSKEKVFIVPADLPPLDGERSLGREA